MERSTQIKKAQSLWYVCQIFVQHKKTKRSWRFGAVHAGAPLTPGRAEALRQSHSIEIVQLVARVDV